MSSIPISDVEKVKNWLDNSDITFYDTGKNMNWVKLLAEVRADINKFVAVIPILVVGWSMDCLGL